MNASFFSASRLVGSGPLSLNASTWLFALVRYSASFAASFGYLLWAGTASHEPPQLPPPPGTDATSHLPLLAGPELSDTMPSIQDGQKVAAKVPCLKPPDHSGDQVDALAEMSAIEVAVSQAFFTAGLVSAM